MTYNGKLTDHDLALIQAEIDRWVRVALSTERCDRPKAEAAVNETYRTAGLEPPKAIIWMDSPMGGICALGVLSQLGGQLRGQLGGQLRGQLRDQLRGQLGGQLWGQLGGQLWGQLGGQLGGQLRGQLGDQLGDQLGGQLQNVYYYGLDTWYEAFWMAYYGQALRVAGLPESDRLTAVTSAVEGIGWWYATPEVAFLTERPTRLARDNQGRLHNEDGPALQYADGYSLSAWHGTRLPEDFFAHEWDVDRIFAEENTEVRRCAIERYGWDRFAAHMTQVGETVPDPGNSPHTLTLYDLPERLQDTYEEKVRILLCTNGSPEADGTRHRFGLVCRGHETDALSAAASLYGIPRDEYAAAEVRR
ncbi:hypothetical protein LWF01_02705 [Saxibacter everestensis]|uniref:DUF6745 domain-containing protein n=1 Tax=Saxibacter everestensis TaxID=2909229 RepID=A0ABY8QUN5_9MICO|nr:hypothetical protein LWF01_02705 [Brevibacteriaceae bacterium ZFBP1038]